MTKPNSKEKHSTVQETAKRMSMQYAKTGSYRTKDLSYVLGDIKQGIGSTVPEANSYCSLGKNK